ncbi:MAG: response regulator [Ignavibacteriaceae bacterium]
MNDAVSVETKKRILLIEDNMDTQLIYKVYLRELYEIDICSTGDSGLKRLTENEYDLLILDINLPGKINGSIILDEIRNNFQDKKIPVLVVTAYAMKTDKRKFLSQGADDYLPKPINKEDFMNKVTQIISSRN